MTDAPLILWLFEIGREDGDKVGGKNASLGEMIRSLRAEGVRVPGGFATTAAAYRRSSMPTSYATGSRISSASSRTTAATSMAWARRSAS